MKKVCTVIFLLTTLKGFSQTPFQAKAKLLYHFMEKNHYKPIVWNDSASVMLYNKWMNDMDDEKLFFTQKDITVLSAYKNKLDDEVLGNGWGFFNESTKLHKRNLLKIDSALKVFFTKSVDINKPDNLTWPSTSYAANDQELIQRWQQYVKWQILQSMAESVGDTNGVIHNDASLTLVKMEADAKAKVKSRELQYLKNMIEAPATAKEDMEDQYLNAIAWCYDPHSAYMNDKERKEFNTMMSAAEYSVGMDVDENDKGDIVVTYLQPGGSAWRSGQVHTGDVLLKVKMEGKEREVNSISKELLESVLHGMSASEIEITIRTKSGETKKVGLTKEKIDSEEEIVKSYLIKDKKNYGYINLPGFYSREEGETQREMTLDGCANDVSKEIVKLKKDSIAGIILDLRFNGGGSMWEAMQLAGIFIDIGPVASVKERSGKVSFLKDPNRGTIYDGPLVVLINGSSASASEFLSAALQDHKRAVIVGGTTYGKGTAQVIVPLDTNTVSNNNSYTDFVKVTMKKFYRVNGSTVQWQGVIPDIPLPDMYADDKYREKANASALQPDQSKVGIYEPSTAPPLAMLATKSRERIDASNYFTTIKNFSSWVKKRSDGRVIPLQWNNYAAMYNEGMKMYKMISNGHQTNTAMQVTNNNYDAQLIDRMETRKRETNAVYIQQVKEDATIEEACSILNDWNNK